MSKQRDRRLSWLANGLLALGVIVLIGGLAWAIESALQTAPDSGPGSNEAQGYPPPDTANTPGVTSTPGVSQSFAKTCEFPLIAEEKNDDPIVTTSGMWSVTSPRIAMTHDTGIGVGSWNQAGDQLLLFRYGPKPGRQTIDLFYTETGELTTLAEGDDGDRSKPKWLGTSGLIAYSDQNTEGISSLRVVDPASKSSSLVAESDKSLVRLEFDSSLLIDDLFFLGADKALMAYSSASRSVVSIDGAGAAELPMPGPNDWPYQLTASPDGQHAVASNGGGSFWLSRDGAPPCRVDLSSILGPSGSLSGVQFSPNGRYLAGRSQRPGTGSIPIPGPFTLLDLQTGKGISLPITKGIGVDGFVWSPDSRAIAAMVFLGLDDSGVSREALVIVDVVSLEATRQLESTEFFSAGVWGMAWNPNGKEIAFACPARDKSGHYFGQLCVAPVDGVK